MRTEARGLFQQANGQIRIELFQPDGGSETGGTRADNCNLVFHDIAGGIAHQIT